MGTSAGDSANKSCTASRAICHFLPSFSPPMLPLISSSTTIRRGARLYDAPEIAAGRPFTLTRKLLLVRSRTALPLRSRTLTKMERAGMDAALCAKAQKDSIGRAADRKNLVMPELQASERQQFTTASSGLRPHTDEPF